MRRARCRDSNNIYWEQSDRGFLIATHDRLRSNGFPIIGVVSAPTSLEAKVSLSQ